MTRMIFVNLPVADLPAARRFYEALGFTNNPNFTDDTAACMVWSDTIFVMLLTHEKWKTFTARPIPDEGSSEVMLCLTLSSRIEVEDLASRVDVVGGRSDVNPPQDHGFMVVRSVVDPDGHVWELTWMDPTAVGHGAQVMEGA